MLKYDYTKERQEQWRFEEKLDKNAVCNWFYSTCTANTLPRKLLKGVKSLK